jgi:murein DD-endopeptidase MepM/ murein hydrolase activator NlpD
MQDYIFNSRRQAAHRRRKFLFRLFLLVLVGSAATYFANQYLNGNSATGDSRENRDLLPLPPVNNTLPAQSGNDTSNPERSGIVPAQNNETPVHSSDTSPPAQVANTVTSPTTTPATPQATPDTVSGLSPDSNNRQLAWKEHTVGKGETLASIFNRQNLSPGLLYKLVNSSEKGKALAKIHPGQTLRFAFDTNNELQQLILVRSRISSLNIKRTEAGFEAEEITRPVERRYASATGIIASSLFVDGHKAGLTDAQVMELAQIFGWDIDFALEIREGDQFHVIYEEQYLDGRKLKNGPILAAEFINRGNIYKAIRYTDKAGDTSYYDTRGNAKRRAFIRTPVKFARISSGFTRKRWHPVLKRWRSHKGVDYAARTGTPVKATGNGKVVFRGKKGGYGNVIFLRHGGKYTTVYGHLSRFAKGLRNGKVVKQGQIIGYVGSTGLATGPHLHYEFRVHGRHQNPLTIKLPKSIRLAKGELSRFKKTTSPLVAQLDELRAKTMVASAH